MVEGEKRGPGPQKAQLTPTLTSFTKETYFLLCSEYTGDPCELLVLGTVDSISCP